MKELPPPLRKTIWLPEPLRHRRVIKTYAAMGYTFMAGAVDVDLLCRRGPKPHEGGKGRLTSAAFLVTMRP
jgi:hypothetical protein